jgi:hypothetical protein
MSMFNNQAVTYDQLIDMIKAMRDANKIDSIHAEECLGGSLESLCVCERRGGSVREGSVLHTRRERKGGEG